MTPTLRIHSIETLGGVDGPGMRCVVFFQGCPLRCLYCQNPDTQAFDGGREMTVEDVMRVVGRMRPYFGTDGGATLSGGEPLAQPAGTAALLEACRAAGIHTALDTGGGCGGAEALRAAALADLLLLDIKHPDPEACRRLTGAGLDAAMALLRAAEAAGQAVWIRHVVVPGWSDTEAAMDALAELLAPFACIRRVELLPYHTLGEPKYAALGRSAPLSSVPPALHDRVARLERRVRDRLGGRRAAIGPVQPGETVDDAIREPSP